MYGPGTLPSRRTFGKLLRMFYCRPGVTPHRNVTLGHGTLGQTGVLHGLFCPFTAPVNSVLAFLTEIAKRDKLAYRMIGVYKSAISQIHDPIGSVPLGELPIVSWFMKGVFRMNPPQPKLRTTWKVQVALDHLKRQRPVEELEFTLAIHVN